MKTESSTPQLRTVVLVCAFAVVLLGGLMSPLGISDVSAGRPGFLFGESGRPVGTISDADPQCASEPHQPVVAGYVVFDGDSSGPEGTIVLSRSDLEQSLATTASCGTLKTLHRFGIGPRIH